VGTQASGQVYCDGCFEPESAMVHIYQGPRGSGTDICQRCFQQGVTDVLFTGPDETFFQRVDAWLRGISAQRRDVDGD
jgi:hypothetical protein